MSTAYSTRKRSCREGFTFVELAIAIAILAILSAIVGPAYMSYVGKARVSSAESSLKTIKLEVNNFMVKTGKAPQSLKDLVRKPADITKRQWGGPYVEEEDSLIDPWGNPFGYKVKPGGHPPFILYSWGADGPGSPEEDWITP